MNSEPLTKTKLFAIRWRAGVHPATHDPQDPGRTPEAPLHLVVGAVAQRGIRQVGGSSDGLYRGWLVVVGRAGKQKKMACCCPPHQWAAGVVGYYDNVQGACSR